MKFLTTHFLLFPLNLLCFSYNNTGTAADIIPTKVKGEWSDAFVDLILGIVRPMILEEGLDPAPLPDKEYVDWFGLAEAGVCNRQSYLAMCERVV